MPRVKPANPFVIYKITNLLNGKAYVGLTSVGLPARWYEHRLLSRKNPRPGRWVCLITRAIAKYGEDAFMAEVIEVCPDRESLSAREVFWISELGTLKPNGYNITAGGERPVMAESTRRKISMIQSGKKRGPLSEATRKKIGDAHRGRKQPNRLTKEQLEILRWRMLTANPFKGRKHSEESKLKMSKAQSGKRRHTAEWLAELSKQQAGSGNHYFGKTHSEEIRKKIKERRWPNGMTPEFRAVLSAAGKKGSAIRWRDHAVARVT